ncbi:MAG: OmpH family outer membrane protein [Acetobacteraceae bacterium]|nr:OmpH family outer membrane protein [Acetobacteraceae bacterium]
MRHLPLPTLLTASGLLLAAVPLLPSPTRAQQNPGYFIPPAARPPAAAAPRAAPRSAGTPAPAYIPPPLPAPVETPPVQLTLPPVPTLPPLAKGQPPPAAVIGVLGVPEIMRASTAAQQVQQAINKRRERLNEDAQREQTAWRELQQQLSNPRSGLSQEQLRAKEVELQTRITNAQRQFRDRNRQIEEAGQFALAQIERTLVGVIRQVAESRGINLVLQRAQVALNTNEFDITPQVTEQLNKVLNQVMIPAEGVNIVVPQEQQPDQLPSTAPAPPPQGSPQASQARAAPSTASSPAAATRP